MNGADHQPEDTFQSSSRSNIATEQTAERQGNDTDRAIHKAHFACAQAKTVLFTSIKEKRGHELDKLGLGEPVQEKKGKRGGDALLLEEENKRGEEILENAA